ncbi:2-phospho-L-lactate guanylyltransferase [Halococcus saccharolyticus]|uniref:2-phospho-L-lactate guanylyltransferase n=1 Tax=Halococcus saccharolyticus DSM 5350 TaxID=1227455 RepID=M0MLU4_9EURY|nr:2-phospho-L-lactate guanylyltransferase [Halococcus saccharolyticus]EMA46657.1 phospholactate guanylyltransferase [Halococcus saccharolyticus DSM 5350]
MRVVVPFAAEQPKTRLADVFTPAERRELARVMLDDVLRALREAGHTPEVLTTATIDVNVPTIVDDRPLNAAVNAVLADGSPVAVVMADLPLATPDAFARLFASDADVVLAPGRGGGTNAFVTRHSSFRVDYHGASYRDHRERAREVGASVATIDSHRLATDVDESTDLVEVLLHGTGETRRWLEERGVRLDTSGDGRVGIRRDDTTAV